MKRFPSFYLNLFHLINTKQPSLSLCCDDLSFSRTRRCKRAARSYRTEGDELLLHLPPPQLQQQAAVRLVEGAGVGQEAGGQKNVPDQVADLSLEAGAAVGPTNLKQHERWRKKGKRMDGCIREVTDDSAPSLLPDRRSEPWRWPSYSDRPPRRPAGPASPSWRRRTEPEGRVKATSVTKAHLNRVQLVCVRVPARRPAPAA